MTPAGRFGALVLRLSESRRGSRMDNYFVVGRAGSNRYPLLSNPKASASGLPTNGATLRGSERQPPLGDLAA